MVISLFKLQVFKSGAWKEYKSRGEQLADEVRAETSSFLLYLFVF